MGLRLVPNEFYSAAVNWGKTSDGCTTAAAIVREALLYFAQHFAEPDALFTLSQGIGTSMECVDFSFDQIRGMTPAEALLDHRLNQLFSSLTERPRQGLGKAIRACGLGKTKNVVTRFEDTFGIDMPLFLLTCRRAAEDRLFRASHPEPEALVLPS
ncbi:MAG: hypothetical protein FJ078_06875 [Cyanobacteria bacterium K_DeepCast_35m_m2_155]|nr:hypothetical protein [Cyanobacteria bacterium K_DeepCast_35m_m2_155]